MATTLRSSIFFYAIVFILLSLTITAKANESSTSRAKVTDVMVEACKNASGYSRDLHIVTLELCLSTLQSDNRSLKAKDHLELVLISFDIFKGHLSIANHHIEKMLQNATKGTIMMRDLSLCKLYYDTTVRIINMCDAMVTNYHGEKGVLKPFELPRCVKKAGFQVDDCGFRLDNDKPWADALINENEQMSVLVNLDYALLARYDVSG